MEQELKNKYPAEFDEISDKYSCYIGDSLSDFEMVSGRSVILPNDIKPMLHSAYTLAKSEYAERIKELEADIKYLKKEINMAGNIAMDLRYEIFAIQKEGSMADKSNKIVFTLSQVASDTTPKQNT